MDTILVILLGVLVGIVELITRYPTSPLSVLRNLPAYIYLLLNGMAAFSVFVLLRRFDVGFGFDSSPSDQALVRILASGLGGMAFLRSSISIRLGGKDVGAKIADLIERLFSVTQDAIDREQATKHAPRVTAIMDGVIYLKAKKALPAVCKSLRRNLPAKRREDLERDLLALEKDKYIADESKALILGVTIMKYVGLDVLDVSVKSLGSRIS